MLVSQTRKSRSPAGQGSLRAVLAELQRQGAAPSRSEDAFRQRLLELSRRLSRVQALGNEYAQVEFSPQVTDVLSETAAV